MIGGSTKASIEEIEAGSELALAEAIANINGVDGESVAGLLDAYLDVAVSTRSSHDWDPDGVIPTTGTVARQSDLDGGGGTDWSSKTPKLANLYAPGSQTDLVELDVSGSGYVMGLSFEAGKPSDAVELVIDGTTVESDSVKDWGGSVSQNNTAGSVPMFYRFDASVTVKLTTESDSSGFNGVLSYVLD